MRVGIVGLGLVGGSLGRVLLAAGHHVVGVDTPAVRRRAIARRWVSETAPSVAQTVPAVDLVVLAAPPDQNLALLRDVASCAPASLLVTDVGSVKRPICRLGATLRKRLRFVGGHPMAGNTGSGLRASDPELFKGRPWILTPAEGAERDARAVQRLLAPTGARFARMTPEAHDRVVAFLSHVPQLVSWALLDAAAGDPVVARSLALAGPGFVGMTRLAQSPKALWREILGQNRDEVTRALRALSDAMRKQW